MMKAEKAARSSLTAITVIVALLIGLILIFPIIYCFLSAFKSRAEFAAYPPSLWPSSFTYLDNFATALQKTPILRFMVNSLIISAIGSFGRILLAALAAYAFAYYDFKGKRFFFMLILGTMMLPADTLIITNYLTVARMNLLDNYLGMCITSMVGASQMFMLRQNFKTIPKSLREAAMLDGCGDFRFLAKVVLPISRPVLLTLIVQSFVSFWNAYLWPLLVTNKEKMRTVQVGIAMLTTTSDTNYTLVMAAVSIILIPSFILFIILRRNIVKGIAAGALVG